MESREENSRFRSSDREQVLAEFWEQFYNVLKSKHMIKDNSCNTIAYQSKVQLLLDEYAG